MRAEFSIFCFLQLLILLIVWLKRATNSILLIFPARLVLMKQLWVRYLHSSGKNICEGSEKKCAMIKSEAKKFFFPAWFIRREKALKGPITHWNECTCALYRYNTISLLLFSSSASFFFISGVQWGMCHTEILQKSILSCFPSVENVFSTLSKVQTQWLHNFPKSNLE